VGGLLVFPEVVMRSLIAVSTGILLVDYTIIARQQHGLSRADAVIDACRKRVRPIVMTTIAIGAGMLHGGHRMGK